MGILEALQNYWEVLAPNKIYPPASTFTTNQIPDLSGRIAIVTGA